jgi:beta-lactam-binding protein with PASTA domain
MKSFFRLLLLALVLLVIALVSALTAMQFAIHGRESRVPDLVGKTPAEARRIAEESGLPIEIERQYYSATVPEGRILSQLPVPGAQVRRGWRLRLAESLGPQRVEIPNLLGESERAAEINIRRRGLDLGWAARISVPGISPDRVVSQSPPPNASDVSSPKISLLVSASPQTQAFVMPTFTGQSLGTATSALHDAGFEIGKVSVRAESSSPSSVLSSPTLAQTTTLPALPASLIVAQDPVSGTKVAAGTMVNFVVR